MIMLCVQALLTLLLCRSAVEPATGMIASAIAAVEPPAACQVEPGQGCARIVVRRAAEAEKDKPHACKSECCGATKKGEPCCAAQSGGCEGKKCVKKVVVGGDKSACGDGQPRMIVKKGGSISGDEPAGCDGKKCIKKVVVGGDKSACGDGQPRVIVKRDGSCCDDEPAECDGKKCIRVKKIVVGADKSACGDGQPCVIMKKGGSCCGDEPAECGGKKCIRVKTIIMDGDKSACGEGQPRVFFGGAGTDGPLSLCDEACKIIARVLPEGCGEGSEPGLAGMKMIRLGPGGSAFCAGDDDGEDVAFMQVADSDEKAGGPWLGVQFGPVSKPLASHLRLGDCTGQMILNIVDDSPADRAGLQQYDVITRIDGKTVSCEIAEFMGVVEAFQVGQSHGLTVMRGGQPAEVTVTIGSRPAGSGPVKYKYEAELEELAQNDVLQRGGILRKSPEGNWVFQGLGNLKDAPKVWQDLPDEESLRFLFDMPVGQTEAGCQLIIRTEKGSSLEIKRTDDQITVTRKTTDPADNQQKVVAKTYANEDELKQADAEAYKVLQECGQKGSCIAVGKGGKVSVMPNSDHIKCFPKDFSMNLKELQKNAAKLQGETQKQQQEAMKLLEKESRKPAGSAGDFFVQRKAQTSFDVTSDGKIRVTTRKGDEELTETYDNAKALQKARPDLYEKYRRLHAGGKTEPQE